MPYRNQYGLRLEKVTMDSDIILELKRMMKSEIEGAFYHDLEFGTGGLCGIIMDPSIRTGIVKK
jgi:hypothetical protein